MGRRNGFGLYLADGATGFPGRYLLRELLATGRPVAVLARDARGRSARDRVDKLVAFGCESLGRVLPQPTVLCGDLALVEAYDWPRPPGPAKGDLLECYSYLNLRPNVGLLDAAFDY